MLTSTKQKVIMVCAKCGSTDVRRDADSAWNTEKQEWELVVAYDNSTCEVCGEECDLEEIKIDDKDNCIYCGLKCYEGQLCDEQQAGGFDEDIEEQTRRDEKNGLYPEKWDDCN